MKILKVLLIPSVSFAFLSSAFAGSICSVKPEAESVKEPLPVKYKHLKEQIETLKGELESCKESKQQVREEISRLESEISQLETEKAQLQMRLSQLPSKESLEAQIKELEREGR